MTPARRSYKPGRGLGLATTPASISPWQFAQTSTHLRASARYACSDFPDATLIANDFVAGST